MLPLICEITSNGFSIGLILSFNLSSDDAYAITSPPAFIVLFTPKPPPIVTAPVVLDVESVVFSNCTWTSVAEPLSVTCWSVPTPPPAPPPEELILNVLLPEVIVTFEPATKLEAIQFGCLVASLAVTNPNPLIWDEPDTTPLPWSILAVVVDSPKSIVPAPPIPIPELTNCELAIPVTCDEPDIIPEPLKFNLVWAICAALSTIALVTFIWDEPLTTPPIKSAVIFPSVIVKFTLSESVDAETISLLIPLNSL